MLFNHLVVPEIVKSKHSLKEPNWEQRRYEIAKDYYVNTSGATPEEDVHQADKLIEALKKQLKNLEDS